MKNTWLFLNKNFFRMKSVSHFSVASTIILSKLRFMILHIILNQYILPVEDNLNLSGDFVRPKSITLCYFLQVQELNRRCY